MVKIDIFHAEIDVDLDHFSSWCLQRSVVRGALIPEQLEIMYVDRSRCVAAVESDLLIPGETCHADAAKQAVAEAVCWILKPSAIEIRLTSVSGVLENNRMKVYPSFAFSSELDSDRPPVGFTE